MNRVSPFCKVILEKLYKSYDKVIFINNNRIENDKDLNFFKNFNISFISVKNEGFDFGMWLKGLDVIDTKSLDSLTLINDSIIFFDSIDNIFDWIKASNFDYCGLTDSYQRGYYIQSYFMHFKASAIPYLVDFLQKHGIQKTYSDVVRVYEYGLSQHLLHKGLKIGSFFSSKDYISSDISIDCAKELIQKGAPFIKKKLITKQFRHYQRFRLENIGFDFNFNYRKLLEKYSDLPIKELLKNVHGNEELNSKPTIHILCDENINLSEQSYQNFKLINDIEELKDISCEHILYLEAHVKLDTNTLYEFAKLINEEDPDFAYCDHSIFSQKNTTHFHHKPKFDAELLKSSNYIGNSFLFRKDAFPDVFQENFSPESIITKLISCQFKVSNIPKALISKPAYNGNSWRDYDSQDYDYFDTCPKKHQAHKDYLIKLCDIEDGPYFGTYIDSSPQSTDETLVLINCNYSEQDLNKLLPSLNNKKITLATTNKLNSFIQKHGEFNELIEETNAEQILVLNDVLKSENEKWIDKLLQYSQKEYTGFIGSKIIDRKGFIMEANMVWGIHKNIYSPSMFVNNSSKGYFLNHHLTQSCTSVSPSCYMIKRKVLEKVISSSEFKDRTLNLAKMCIQAKKLGFSNIYQANATLTVVKEYNFKNYHQKEWNKFSKQYQFELENDGHFSPALNKLSPFNPDGWSYKYMAPTGSRELLRAGIKNLYSKLGKLRSYNIALYGAGQHTHRLLKEKSLKHHEVKYIFDDNPKLENISNIPVISSREWNKGDFEILVISSDTIEEFLLLKALQSDLKNKTIMCIYSDFFTTV